MNICIHLIIEVLDVIAHKHLYTVRTSDSSTLVNLSASGVRLCIEQGLGMSVTDVQLTYSLDDLRG